MRSIGARLTFWYACAATISFAIMSVLGVHLLQSRLIAGLDDLNAAEFRQLARHIGSDYATLGPTGLEKRLANVDQYESVLFYVSIDYPKSDVSIFTSQNLRGRKIPDIKGRRAYSVDALGIGPLRVHEFLLPPYDVTVATSSRSIDESVRAYEIVSAALIATMLLASIGIGLGVSRIVLRPLRAIRETADRIRSDNLSERIPVSDVKDDLSDLVVILNRTFDRLEAAFIQLRHFSEEVSHELKTPLSLIRLHAEKILKAEDPTTNVDSALEQVEEIARLSRFIDQMLFLARAEAGAITFDLQPVKTRDFIDAFVPDAIVLAEHSGQRFVAIVSGGGAVAIEASWLRQVLYNLLANALKVAPAGSEVRLTSTLEDGHWRIVVEDDGPGVSDIPLERIFERFYRGREGGGNLRGAGLGLAISRSIIALHGGRIFAERSRALKGLAVTIELAAEGSPAMLVPAITTHD